ncbi:hypothetical protein ABK040_002573 [Willaertia magna]
MISNEISNNKSGYENDDTEMEEENKLKRKRDVKDNEEEDLLKRIKACLILGAVGDTIGYCRGDVSNTEFTYEGKEIHRQLNEYFGGLSGVNVTGWIVSDDTVMHLATARGLINWASKFNHQPIPTYTFNVKDENSCKIFMNDFVDPIAQEIGKEYIICWDDMHLRAAGDTCGNGVYFLQKHGVENWQKYLYSNSGGGCGGSMRSQIIGVAFSGKERRDMLIASSIESGRLTHNHATGFLGALVSSLFCAFAFEKEIPPSQWGIYLLYDILPRCKEYLRYVAKRDWKVIEKDMKHFEDQFIRYLKDRNIYLEKEIAEKVFSVLSELQKGTLQKENLQKEELELLNLFKNFTPKFPKNYGVEERDEYYTQYSFAGFAGGSGDDSCIIAYDAILCAGQNNYETMMLNGALHGGDCDSTGSIAASWYGAMYGWNNVYESNWKNVEKKEEMLNIAYDIRTIFF